MSARRAVASGRMCRLGQSCTLSRAAAQASPRHEVQSRRLCVFRRGIRTPFSGDRHPIGTPGAEDLDDFQFQNTPINETLVHDLAGGGFIAQQRNAVLVGGTGTGKTHLAIAIARSCIRSGARGRFYNVVDLVNRLRDPQRTARSAR